MVNQMNIWVKYIPGHVKLDKYEPSGHDKLKEWVIWQWQIRWIYEHDDLSAHGIKMST